MADLNDGELLQDEIVALATPSLDPKQAAQEKKDLARSDQIRTIIADTYTFVRSQELNRVIGAFTLDHYIDEAKRRIKGTGRQIVDAAGKVIMDDKGTVPMTRPSLLDYLTKLQADFTSSYPEALKMAQNADTKPPVKPTTTKTGP